MSRIWYVCWSFAVDTPRVSGALNAVSPEPVTHERFQKVLAHQLRRPLWLRVPALLLRATLGDMSQLLVDGQRVVPSRATALGFKFRHRRIQDALSDLFGAGAPDHLPSEVYFNGNCPVCRTEMTHYATLCENNQSQFQFIDSMQRQDEFIRYGLRREHLERRVYLRDARGRVLSGMPALVHLWSKIPAYRWLSRTLTLPVLRPVSTILYDHVIAPSLAFWANRREMSRASTRHGWF